ncbi:glutaredoxin family protein [Alginatibacterium sediminis]|uniref:Glutaredoxin family protein n=1 Tax=Alginatibacterium sediminis TaxID=2164068 RepID=A0A420EGX1_9ALTE|nr:glutaredoxin family protein [Alginatibacterium sediminis]RKF19918.1 glutaredoxin family protein [Alginatibacterium sediminis]
MSEAKFVLYHTQGCHLCEQAHALWLEINSDFDIQLLDIVTQEQLSKRYAYSIPVIRNLDQGDELAWPFDAKQLQQFIQRTVC